MNYPLKAEIVLDTQKRESDAHRKDACCILEHIREVISPWTGHIEFPIQQSFYHPNEECEVRGIEFVRYSLRIDMLCANYMQAVHIAQILSGFCGLLREVDGKKCDFLLIE